MFHIAGSPPPPSRAETRIPPHRAPVKWHWWWGQDGLLLIGKAAAACGGGVLVCEGHCPFQTLWFLLAVSAVSIPYSSSFLSLKMRSVLGAHFILFYASQGLLPGFPLWISSADLDAHGETRIQVGGHPGGGNSPASPSGGGGNWRGEANAGLWRRPHGGQGRRPAPGSATDSRGGQFPGQSPRRKDTDCRRCRLAGLRACSVVGEACPPNWGYANSSSIPLGCPFRRVRPRPGRFHCAPHS